MEGTYKLADDTTGKCGLRLKEEEGGKLRVSVKVANSMNLVLTKAGDKWTGGPVMSTKGGVHLDNFTELMDLSIMMPVPALESLEKEMSDLLSNLTDIRKEGDTVVIEAGDKKAVFLSE